MATTTMVTVLGIPTIILSVRKSAVLATRGVWSDATVHKISILRVHGSCPVTFSYFVNGSQYFATRDVETYHASKYKIGAVVPIVYHPTIPRCCEIMYRPKAQDVRGGRRQLIRRNP